MLSRETAAPAAAAPARRPWPLGPDHLLALMALALVACVIALAPTTTHDFWWHLRVGQIVAGEGVPTTNRYAWTVPADAPFVYAGWLSEWAFYQAAALGGPGAAVLLRNLLGALGFGLVGVEARRRSGSWRAAALAVALAGLMAINNLTTRPQNWVWPLVPAYMLVLGAYAAGQARARWLLALPALMAVWVNVHGSFPLGLGLVALFAAGETLRRLLAQPGALGWGRLAALYAAGAGSAAAALLNPAGLGIFGYVQRLLGNSTIRTMASEWQPPTVASFAGQIFFASVLALLAGAALARRRLTLTDTLVACALLWLALGGFRNVVWFGMAAMPMLAQGVAAREDRPDRRDAPATLLGALLVALVVAVQPPLKPLLPLPAAYKGFFADVPGAPELFSRDTPVAAAAALRADPPARLFNEMGFGSYLAWAAPEVRVFVDARLELYPDSLWRDYVAILEARDYDALLIDKYDVDRVMVSSSGPLAAALAKDPRWERTYDDRLAAIYRRRAPAR